MNTTPTPQALLIAPGWDAPKTIEPNDGKAFTLPEIQAQIEGLATFRTGPDGRLFILNAEAELLGLPPNPMASAMALLDPTQVFLGRVMICNHLDVVQ